jgi:hypothetical protein
MVPATHRAIGRSEPFRLQGDGPQAGRNMSSGKTAGPWDAYPTRCALFSRV